MKSHVNLSRAETANSHQNDSEFISRTFTSRKEFVNEYKQIYFGTAKAKELYHHILNELNNTATGGNIDNFKKFSSLIDDISHVENKVRLRTFIDDANNPIKSTNLVILVCQNNKVKILEYMFSKDCNILNNLAVKVGKNSILPDDEDETGHNAFYYAIRSGSVELIDALINKWNGKYFSAHLDELEIILSKNYEELKLKNVLLSDEMEIFVESKLIDLRFYSKRKGQIKSLEDHTNIEERIDLVLENISLLNSNLEVGERFLFIAKFIASNIHILKNQLKSTYDRLPWEEIEFCLVSFISSHTKQQEINLFYQATLNKEKILDYLKTFADLLKDLKVNIKCINISKFVLSNLNREKIVLDIIESCPQFQELYNDYQFIRDISSLGKISNCLDLASSVDAKEREGQLVITRVLQVMGEYFKNTLESPKLSSTTSQHLLLSLPKNTRKVVTDLRNSLSHAYSLSMRTEIEENTDANFFAGIQKDVQKIGVVIKDNLYQNKLKLVRNLLKKIIDSKTLAEITEVAELLNNVKVDDVIKCSKLIEHKEIEKLIDELNNVQAFEKSEYEKGILNKIKDVINVENAKLSNTETNYAIGLESLKRLSSLMLNNKIGLMSIIKIDAEKIFNNITPKLEPRKFKEIAELSAEFYRSVRARIQPDQFDEVSRLLLEIRYISEFGRCDINWIEKLRERLNEFPSIVKNKKRKTSSVPNPEEKYGNHLALKLNDLKKVFSKYALSTQLIQELPSYKSNTKLQSAVEMLVLDIMSILGNSNNLVNDQLFLDDRAPLLIGKCLRNHLAHDNSLLEVLLSDPSIAVLLNAKKLVTDNVIKIKNKIGNCVREDPSMLRDKYNQGLFAITNQERMFVALEEGNLEELKNCINIGADINARSVSLWTSGHFAAKGPSLDVMKFIHAQNLKLNVKNINSQTPLHIAATYGRKSNVEFLVEVVGLHVDDLDDAVKTPLHFAAQNGHLDTVKELLKKKANSFAKDIKGCSALHLAVQNNFKGVVETLLENEVNVDCNKYPGGATSLLLAAERGHLELVNFFIQRGADVNAKNDLNGTALHTATINSHKDVIIALILKGADINAKYLDGCTPLHYAVLNGHKEGVDVLLKHGVKVNVACTTYYNTPLHYAAQDGYEEIVNGLLLNGANANATTVERLTPLYFATRDGHVGVVNKLLKHGVDINAKNIRNSSALHIAAARGHVEIVKILIKNKASVNAKDNNDITPLHIAALGGHSDVMDLLIKSNAEVDAQDKVGGTPLFKAAMSGSLDCIALLIKNNANINEGSYGGLTRHTPLFASALNGHIKAVELLIKNEAEINAGANIGLTPLHASAQGGHKAVIDLLIENKAEVNVRDIAGNTPLHTAVDAGHKEVIELLLAKGSDANVKNKLNKTPLHSAVKNNREKIVEILIANGANVDSEASELFSMAILSGFRSITEILLKNSYYHNIKYSADISLLHLAAKTGHDEIVSALIRKGADVHAKDIGGETPLHFAARDGQSEVVKVLLNNGAKINIKDLDNRMPVELAVSLNRLQVVKTLLQNKDVDVNAKGNDDFTLLHIAVQQGNLEMAKLLTDNGANINAKNNMGSKPVHIAARDGFKDIVKFFLSNGSSINDLGISNKTLLHYAAQGGQSEVAKYLVQQGVDVNAKDTGGLTPMHLATILGKVDIINILLNNGAVYNAIDIYNKNPLEMTQDAGVINLLTSVNKLFKAVKCNSPSEVRKCIHDGAIVNAINAKEETPLHIAAWKGYESIVDILVQNKGNPNAVGKDGFTPMHYAAKFSHLKVVKILLAKGAKYNVASHSGKTPLDFADNKAIISIIKLVNETFKNVINSNSKVIADLKKVKDIDTIKAVMNARDNENKSIIVVAMLNNFPKVQQLKETFQEDVSAKVKEAVTLANNDNYQKSLSILRNIFEKRKEILGPDNPGTLDIQIHIAFIVYTQGYYQEALGMYEEILPKQESILGFNCKDALKTRDFIALVYHRLGRNEEALIIYKEVIKRQKEIFQPNDLDCLNTQLDMALVLDGLGKYEEALRINRHVFIMFKEILGVYHQSTLHTQNNIAMVLFKQKKYEEALSVYDEVYEKRKVVLGLHHSDTIRTLHNRASILVEQNKSQEAFKTYKEIYNTQKQTLGSYHVDTMLTHYNMANLLFEQGMFISALKAYKEGFEQRKAILGPSHFIISDTMKIIQTIYKHLKMHNYDSTNVNLYLNNDLNVAANNGDLKMVQHLIKIGSEVNEKDIEGRAPLHFATDNRHIDIVNILMKNGADVTQFTHKGNTALHMAASKGYAEMVEVLLQHVNRAKLNDFIDAKTIGGGTTSIHVASKNGSLDVVKILLKYGATYNIENKEGKTPLDLSKDVSTIKLLKLVEELFKDSRNGNVEIIDKLKAVKSDELRAVINARNDKGKTLIQVAVTNQHRDLASRIISIAKN